jgi:hypothetical protein
MPIWSISSSLAASASFSGEPTYLVASERVWGSIAEVDGREGSCVDVVPGSVNAWRFSLAG